MNPDQLREECIQAANANHSILKYRSEGQWYSSCWSEEVICRNPPMRIEFEHAIVLATPGEAWSMRKSKNGWGALLKVEPLKPNDFLYPVHITYQLKASSKARQRWEFRDTFKQILGRDRGLVNRAMRQTKKGFLTNLENDARQVIQAKLHLDAAQFWQAVRNGDRYGPDGILRFVKELNERTHGYEFAFMQEEHSVVEDQVSV